MASASNRVIAGEFSGKSVKYGFMAFHVTISNVNYHVGDLHIDSYGSLEISKSNVASYEVVTEEKMKSGTSAIMRGALGAAVLGPVGILAGLTAKSKGIYHVAVEWKNGKKSLLEVDEKIYKEIVRELF